MSLPGGVSRGHPCFLPDARVGVREARDGIKTSWVIRRIKRLDPEGREGAKVSPANEEGCLLTRLQGARISLERVVLSLPTSPQRLRTTPISRKPSLPWAYSTLLLLRLETEAQRWGWSRTHPRPTFAEAFTAVPLSRRQRPTETRPRPAFSPTAKLPSPQPCSAATNRPNVPSPSSNLSPSERPQVGRAGGGWRKG